MPHPSGHPRRRPSNTANLYSDTEERDAGLTFLDRRVNRTFPDDRANRTFPEDHGPDDTNVEDRFANATFPGGRRGPRDLRRTNAFYSRVPRSIRDLDGSDDLTTSQETGDSLVHLGGEGRSADHTDMAEHPRDLRRYRPYDRNADRPRVRAQAPHDRRRSEPRESSQRHSSNSTEEGDATPYNRNDLREPAPNHLPTNQQALHAMLQTYVKCLPEPQRKAFWQEITPGPDLPNSDLMTKGAMSGPVKATGVAVVGLLAPPAASHPEEKDHPDDDEVDLEQLEDVLSQLTNIVHNSKVRPGDETSAVMEWFQPLLDKLNGSTISETLLHETIIKITTKAHAKAVELKEKALAELDKIETAEKEKLRLIEAAREDFKKILLGQHAELGLLDAGFEEKTKTLRKKAEKLLTPGQICEEAFDSVRDRRSSKAKGRR